MLLPWKHVDECLKLEDSFESKAATRARLEREDRENERRMVESERRMVNMRKTDRREQVERKLYLKHIPPPLAYTFLREALWT